MAVERSVRAEAGEATAKRRGAIRREIAIFWDWYERHYAINVTVATVLFTLQLVHLTWLGLHVVAMRLAGHSYFQVRGFWLNVLVVVDLLEIPALVSVSLVYINELRSKRNVRSFLYLVMLNSQWVHILWITDEFVVGRLSSVDHAWPVWLAWVAIGIDYLELPVMADTTRRFVQALAGKASLREVFRSEGPRRRRELVVTSLYCPGLSLRGPALAASTQSHPALTFGGEPAADEDAMCCSDVVS